MFKSKTSRITPWNVSRNVPRMFKSYRPLRNDPYSSNYENDLFPKSLRVSPLTRNGSFSRMVS